VRLPSSLRPWIEPSRPREAPSRRNARGRLSGGADSVALLDALASLRRRRGFRVVAATRHGLRAGSRTMPRSAQALPEARRAAPRRVGRRPGPAPASGVAGAGRRRDRYAFLRRVRDDEGPSPSPWRTRGRPGRDAAAPAPEGSGRHRLAGCARGARHPPAPPHRLPTGGAGPPPRARARLAGRPHQPDVTHRATAYVTSSSLPGGALQPAGPGGARPHRGGPRDEAAHVRAEAEALLGRIAREEAGARDEARAPGRGPDGGRPCRRPAGPPAERRPRAGERLHVDRVLHLARAKAPSGRRLLSRGGAKRASRETTSGSKGVPARARKPYHREEP